VTLPSGEVYLIQVRNTTPLLTGWYKPNLADPIGLRPSEIKGLWNWWARAFISGAMYDLGLLWGSESPSVLLKPKRAEAEAIACLVGKILGLGYVGRAGSEASRFAIRVEHVSPGSLVARKFENSLQRIRLLSLGERVVRGYGKGHLFQIIVKKRTSKYRVEELTALKILVASLLLSGVGKGARRGLGSLDVKPPDVITERSIKDLLASIYRDSVEIVEKARSKYYRECAQFLGDLRDTGQGTSLPPLPCISKRSIEGLEISRIFTARGVSFEPLHNFFVRSARCRVLVGSAICSDDLRNALAAWILGLPRGREEETGYSIKTRNISRRASPVIMSYHEGFNAYGDGAYVSTFVSGDWPKQLEWTNGSTTQTINIDTKTLINAYRIVISELERYLKKLNASVQHIWP
jgi:CRISPR-associated protein Cmr1